MDFASDAASAIKIRADSGDKESVNCRFLSSVLLSKLAFTLFFLFGDDCLSLSLSVTSESVAQSAFIGLRKLPSDNFSMPFRNRFRLLGLRPLASDTRGDPLLDILSVKSGGSGEGEQESALSRGLRLLGGVLGPRPRRLSAVGMESLKRVVALSVVFFSDMSGR